MPVLDNMEYATDVIAQTNYPSNGHHVITFVATAELDTAVKKWGLSSLLLDGNSDYLTIPTSTDWNICGSNSDDWTIDFWVKLDDSTRADESMVGQRESGTDWWEIGHDGCATNGLRFIVFSGGGVMINTGHGAGDAGWIPDANWHHVAMCKVGSKYACYLDGTQVNYTDDADVDTFTGALSIGARTAPSCYLDGHMDEVRIIHSNIFGANPNATPNDTITPPTSAHQISTSTKLSLHFDGADAAQTTIDGSRFEAYSEGTKKVQGTHSLKGIALITDSLNDILTRTVDPPVDLSGITTIRYYIYSASRTGSHIKIGIHDSGGTTTEHTANILATGGWEGQEWDISGVIDANKDDIDGIKITVVNADAANIFYLDWMYTALTKALADTLTLSESHGSGVSKVLADTLALAESLAFQRLLALVDTLTLTDLIAKKPKKVLAETLALSDSIAKMASKALADTLTLSDSDAKKVFKVFTDVINLTDSVLRTFQRPLTDTLALSDAVLRKFQRPLADTLTLADSLVKNVMKAVVDTITLTDARVSEARKAILDTITLTDSEVKKVSKVLSDVLSLADEEVKKVCKVLTDTLSISESIYVFRILALVDTLSLTDSEVKKVSKVLSDTLTLTESEYLQRILELADTLGLDDWHLQKLRGVR